MDVKAGTALNTQVVQAKRQPIETLNPDEGIRYILITMNSQLHTTLLSHGRRADFFMLGGTRSWTTSAWRTCKSGGRRVA